MARIRTIKPEFFTSEDICSLSPLARLLYIALWCEADRDGRLEWKPKTFKLRYLPGDECDIDALSNELVSAGLVVLYDAEGKHLAEILTFTKHQVINNRESESQYPARVVHASNTRSSRVKAEGKEGREGKEGDSTKPQGDLLPDLDLPAAPVIAVVEIPLVDKTEHPVTQAQIDDWAIAYPAVDIVPELRRMRSWCEANPAQKKTQRGANPFIVRWLSNAQDKSRGGGGRGSSRPDGDVFV